VKQLITQSNRKNTQRRTVFLDSLIDIQIIRLLKPKDFPPGKGSFSHLHPFSAKPLQRLAAI